MKIKAELAVLFYEQIQMELEAHFIYNALGHHLYGMKYFNMAKFMYGHAQEEYTHAQKLIDHLLERENEVIYHPISVDKMNFSKVSDVFKRAYEHEVSVSQSIRNKYVQCEQKDDFEAHLLFEALLREQVEEEHLSLSAWHKVERAEAEKALTLLDNAFSVGPMVKPTLGE